jgi:hypothetical protein
MCFWHSSKGKHHGIPSDVPKRSKDIYIDPVVTQSIHSLHLSTHLWMLNSGTYVDTLARLITAYLGLQQGTTADSWVRDSVYTLHVSTRALTTSMTPQWTLPPSPSESCSSHQHSPTSTSSGTPRTLSATRRHYIFFCTHLDIRVRRAECWLVPWLIFAFYLQPSKHPWSPSSTTYLQASICLDPGFTTHRAV